MYLSTKIHELIHRHLHDGTITEEMASCNVGFGFLLADVPNMRFIVVDDWEERVEY